LKFLKSIEVRFETFRAEYCSIKMYLVADVNELLVL